MSKEACQGCNNQPKLVYIKGGRKVGIYNGDIESGTYIDINGHFISKEGFALDENGYILTDNCKQPIQGSTPSYIPISQYKPHNVKAWLSQFEVDRKHRFRPLLPKRPMDLIILDYFRIFNIRVNVPDSYLFAHDAFYKVWRHHMWNSKTVEANRIEVFRIGEM